MLRRSTPRNDIHGLFTRPSTLIIDEFDKAWLPLMKFIISMKETFCNAPDVSRISNFLRFIFLLIFTLPVDPLLRNRFFEDIVAKRYFSVNRYFPEVCMKVKQAIEPSQAYFENCCLFEHVFAFSRTLL